MKVILNQDIPKLGKKWDVIIVKDGYAQNFLFPKKMAQVATTKLIKQAETVVADRVKDADEVVSNAKELATKLKGVTLNLKGKAKEDKLYGSITEKDIMEELEKQEKIKVTKEMVKMDEHLKTTGEHKVKLQLAENTSITIKVVIEAEV